MNRAGLRGHPCPWRVGRVVGAAIPFRPFPILEWTLKCGSKMKAREGKKVTLLSGGNPQIPKGEGDAPVQAYIAAMPDWKREIGRRLDALIVATVPDVHKAVKWNSPFYGVQGEGWFLN